MTSSDARMWYFEERCYATPFFFVLCVDATVNTLVVHIQTHTFGLMCSIWHSIQIKLTIMLSIAVIPYFQFFRHIWLIINIIINIHIMNSH